MYHSLHLGKIAGISLEINASWLIILVLLTVSLALGWFPAAVPGLPQGAYWGLGLIAAVLLFVSVLAHELAHSLVANARGLPVKSITLFIFGGVSNLEKEPRTPGSEFQITIVGPLTSLVIAVICWFIHNALLGVSLPAAAVFGYLAITNALLTVFNLIPGFPLDGGRLLRSILWKATGNLRTATRWATRVGQVIAWLFILAGIWLFFTGNFLDGLWLGFIGWFLLSSAQAASGQAQLEALFGRTTVGELMNPTPVTVLPGLTIEQLVERCFLPYALRAAPVVQDGQLTGLVSLTDIRRIPREQWGQMPVGQVMVPRERLHVVAPRQPLSDAAELMGRYSIHQVPVVQDGNLLGMISRDAIIRFLEIRRGLGLQEAEQQIDLRLPRAS